MGAMCISWKLVLGITELETFHKLPSEVTDMVLELKTPS